MFVQGWIRKPFTCNYLASFRVHESKRVAFGPGLVFAWDERQSPPPSIVEMRNVELLRTEGEVAAIGKGLVPGEVVVTDGVDKLQQGSKVTTSSSPSAGARGFAAPGKRPPAAGSPHAPSAPQKSKRR